jgi:hypothetical protein
MLSALSIYVLGMLSALKGGWPEREVNNLTAIFEPIV